MSVIDTASNTVVGTVSGVSGFEIAIPPLTAPTGLTATVGDGAVYLSWDPPSEPIDGFNVYIERFNGTTFVPLGTVNQTGVLIQDSTKKVFGLPSGELIRNGDLYRFKVASKKNGIESNPSNFVLARPNDFAAQIPASREQPILFLHGINSDASAWDDTKNFLHDTVKWTFGGNLEIIPYGQLDEDPNNLRVCTFGDPCAKLTGGSIIGDFYTATFSDKLANYTNNEGIKQQGREAKAFIDKLHKVFPSLTIVAHSMGGLAARAYMEGHPNEAANTISELITYGTPHRGVNLQDFRNQLSDLDLCAILFPLSICPALAVAVHIHVDPILSSRGGADQDANCSGSPSPFLQSLRPENLPSETKYTAIVGHNQNVFRDFNSICLAEPDGVVRTDGIVPMVSADLSTTIAYPVRVIKTDRFHGGGIPFVATETSDFSHILCALDPNCFIATVHSPVDIEITAPDGRSMARQLAEIPEPHTMK